MMLIGHHHAPTHKHETGVRSDLFDLPEKLNACRSVYALEVLLRLDRKRARASGRGRNEKHEKFEQAEPGGTWSCSEHQKIRPANPNRGHGGTQEVLEYTIHSFL